MMEPENQILLKVCGMRERQNILAVADLRPEYMGFIFYDKSPRYVGAGFELPEDFPYEISTVGVFVNASTSEMIGHAERAGLDFLQLHGNESVDQVKELRNEGIGIFKVFSVDDNFDFGIVEPYEEYVDYFLFDTKGRYYGGNAKRFDWTILSRYNQRVPFLLSGGLTVENLRDVNGLRGMNVHAVDINSGVESAPGIKDLVRLKEAKDIITNRNNSL